MVGMVGMVGMEGMPGMPGIEDPKSGTPGIGGTMGLGCWCLGCVSVWGVLVSGVCSCFGVCKVVGQVK